MIGAIKVRNYYDKNLQKITLRDSEEATVSEGTTFLEYLYFFFSSYPEIEQIFPPGLLGFTINGHKPDDFTILNNGDKVNFFELYPWLRQRKKSLVTLISMAAKRGIFNARGLH